MNKLKTKNEEIENPKLKTTNEVIENPQMKKLKNHK